MIYPRPTWWDLIRAIWWALKEKVKRLVNKPKPGPSKPQ